MDGSGDNRRGETNERVALSRRRLLQMAAGTGVGTVTGVSSIRPVQATGPGTERWSVSTGDEVRSSPTVVNGTVYIGSNDGYVYALDGTDGTLEWKYETGGRVRSVPTVVDETVYVGSSDENVYALDAADGSQKWAFSTSDRVWPSPTVVDGVVYVGSYDNNVYALDAVDGSQKWAYQTDDSIFSSPTVVDGIVYIGGFDYTVYALDATDGSQKWTVETGDRIHSCPTIVDGTVYVGSDDNNVYALDEADGSQKWAYQTDDEVWSSPAVTGATVYIGSNDNTVYALTASDGTVKWSTETDNSILQSSPTVADGTVYIGSRDGYVYALDTADGTQKWAFETGGQGRSSPVVVDGTLYIGREDHTVYAIETAHSDSGIDSRVLLGTLSHHHAWTGDSAAASLATFVVNITETNEPVVEGERLEVSALVDNTGEETDTQTVILSVDGQEVDSTETELGRGESRDVTLNWSTDESDSGSHQVTVESDDDSDQTDVTVEEPAAFSVGITDLTEPVVEGDTLEVTADIENTGDVSDTQTLVLEIDGVKVDSTSETLNGSESTAVTLDWETTEGDADSYEVAVTSEDTSDQTDVTVHETAGFLVAIRETNAPVEAGGTLEVTTAVQNTSSAEDTQTLTLDINGDQHDSNTLTLDSGESQELTLDWTAENRNGVGVRVASDDNVDNSHVSLTPEADKTGESAIEILDANTPVSEGDTLEIDVEITNTGDEELTQDVDFDVDGQHEETRNVTVGAGESRVETFTWTVDSRTSVGLRAASADDWDNSFLLLADTDFMLSGL